jgi:hypothetical protein
MITPHQYLCYNRSRYTGKFVPAVDETPFHEDVRRNTALDESEWLVLRSFRFTPKKYPLVAVGYETG